MGQPGKFYNILSDKNVQYNALFEEFTEFQKDATAIGQAGIQVGRDRITFNRQDKIPTLNGQPLAVGRQSLLDGAGFVDWNGTRLNINTGEYTILLGIGKDGAMTSDVSINAGGPFADGVTPHGLLGQTADGVDGPKNNGRNLGKQGGTVIDGTVNDYEVQDLWGQTATFNRFEFSPV
jgi:hypothetical protein